MIRIASFGRLAFTTLLIFSIFSAASVAVDDEHDVASGTPNHALKDRRLNLR